MKILAFTKYCYEGPSSRYRFYNYQKEFLNYGIEMTLKSLFGIRYFKTTSKWQKIVIVFLSYMRRFFPLGQVFLFPKKYDLVLIEYEFFPYFPAWFEWLLHKRGIKYIVDYDDAIFHKYDMSSNRLIKYVLKNKIAKVMGYAEKVIVCNTYLETYAKKYNEHTLQLPTVVLLDKYKEKMKTFKKEEDTFVIGWIGSRTTSLYVLEILPAMQKFVERYPKVRFNLIGFDDRLLTPKEKERCHIKVIPWNEESEIEQILEFEIGIMPLNNDPWSRGKCGFKLIQYMSCKKPVIASSVGMNISLVKEGENGLLVKTTDEWFEAFEKLYVDENLRVKMTDNNFNKIEKEYNNKIYSLKYVNMLQKSI